MKKWRVSAGSAAALGLRRIKTSAPTTTAYLMLGEGCKNNCAFCAQARESSTSAKFLSRVSWLPLIDDDVVTALTGSDQQRVCLQVVSNQTGYELTKEALSKLAVTGLPVAVSTHLNSVEQVQKLLAAGAQRVGLAIDVADPALYARIKGGDFAQKWEFILACARMFPDRITTHIIVGLGETEQQVLELAAQCVQASVTVALFAFTPIVGTQMEQFAPPAIGTYRRIQIGYWLLKHGVCSEELVFEAGVLTAVKRKNWQALLQDGGAFRTSGCSGCNRPYYNEKPGGTMYNYPWQPTREQIAQAIAESGLAATI